MQGQSNGQRAFVDCTPGCTHLPAIELTAKEDMDVDRTAELQAMVDWICDDLEAQTQPLLEQTESSSLTASSTESSQSSISTLLPVSQLYSPQTEDSVETTTALPQCNMNIPFKPTCETESEGELVASTAEQDEEDFAWTWDDDIWESTSPALANEDDMSQWYDIWDFE